MHLVEYRICLPFTVEEVSLNILNEPFKKHEKPKKLCENFNQSTNGLSCT